ncbi:hypothetical protein ACFU7T_03180 [Streptomyces sp. NPDC057555]|uniref:hypothetical protein n=1 Tax=Streptomyces sp. NPDC057555 TaxID=3346166 RepID=UPI0036825972
MVPVLRMVGSCVRSFGGEPAGAAPAASVVTAGRCGGAELPAGDPVPCGTEAWGKL